MFLGGWWLASPEEAKVFLNDWKKQTRKKVCVFGWTGVG